MAEPDESFVPLPPPEPIEYDEAMPAMPVVHYFAGDPMTYQGSSRLAAGAEVPPNATLIAPPPSWPGNTIIWNGEAWERIDDREVASRKAVALEERLAAATTEDNPDA